jgi:hypothetical protein
VALISFILLATFAGYGLRGYAFDRYLADNSTGTAGTL